MRWIILLLCVFLGGCASYPKPDPSLIVWGQASEEASFWRAKAQSEAVSGMFFRVAATGSMEPFLTGGDYAVVDFGFPFKAIQPGMVLVYDANWLDQNMPLVGHMAVQKTGDAWVMTGIANHYSEAGAQAMTFADYRGRVVQVYTVRAKP